MKKKKMTALLALLLLSVLPMSAQWKTGVQVGYTSNSISINENYFYDRHYESRGGFTVSVPVQYNFLDWLAVEAEVNYVQKNYRIQRSENYDAYSTNYTNHYLSIPLYAHFSFGGTQLRGFMNAGFYAGYWLKAHRKGGLCPAFGVDYSNPQTLAEQLGIYDYDEDMSFDKTRDNRFEAGALVGIGVQYQINRRLQVTAEGRYYYSMTNMKKKYMLQQSPQYNNTIAIQVGLLVTL